MRPAKVQVVELNVLWCLHLGLSHTRWLGSFPCFGCCGFFWCWKGCGRGGRGVAGILLHKCWTVQCILPHGPPHRGSWSMWQWNQWSDTLAVPWRRRHGPPKWRTRGHIIPTRAKIISTDGVMAVCSSAGTVLMYPPASSCSIASAAPGTMWQHGVHPDRPFPLFCLPRARAHR